MATTPSEGQNLRETTDGPNWWRCSGTVLLPSRKQTHLNRRWVGGRREAAADQKAAYTVCITARAAIVAFAKVGYERCVSKRPRLPISSLLDYVGRKLQPFIFFIATAYAAQNHSLACGFVESNYMNNR